VIGIARSDHTCKIVSNRRVSTGRCGWCTCTTGPKERCRLVASRYVTRERSFSRTERFQQQRTSMLTGNALFDVQFRSHITRAATTTAFTLSYNTLIFNARSACSFRD